MVKNKNQIQTTYSHTFRQNEFRLSAQKPVDSELTLLCPVSNFLYLRDLFHSRCHMFNKRGVF